MWGPGRGRAEIPQGRKVGKAERRKARKAEPWQGWRVEMLRERKTETQSENFLKDSNNFIFARILPMKVLTLDIMYHHSFNPAAAISL